MKLKSSLRKLTLILALVMAGCSTHTGTLSRDPVAYIRLQGVSENHVAVVDDLNPVQLDPRK